MARKQTDVMMMHEQELGIFDSTHLEFPTKTPWRPGELIRRQQGVFLQDVVVGNGFK
jgi:hypothetical protein